MSKKKKFDHEYIEKVRKTIHEVMYQEPAATDWSQICLSVRDAMLVVSTYLGPEDDEKLDLLNKILAELTVSKVIKNLRDYNIYYERKRKASLKEEKTIVSVLVGQDIVRDLEEEGPEYVRKNHKIHEGNLVNRSFNLQAEAKAYIQGLEDANIAFTVLSDEVYAILKKD